MNSKYLPCPRHALALGLLACFFATGLAGAATTLIDADLNNGSFEYVNGVNDPSYTSKIQLWDGSPSGEIDNWTQWDEVATSSGDSGTEVWTPAPAPPAGPTGVRFAFLQPGNAVYNLTTYTIQAGDTFTFSWDHIGTRNHEHVVSLVYFDGASVQAVPETDVVAGASGFTYGDTFTIAADSPAVGWTVGIGIVNTSSDWPEVDNFILTVTPVPEPTTAALLGTLGLFAFWKFLPRRRTSC